ncbi:sodium-independent anion transporter [Planctomycetota bacterium]|nr:sodium-independent anion transporter [Planctomycetota bacterium]
MRLSPLPALRWFPLSAPVLRADVVAGLTVGLLCVPQAMAYAQLAGMPAFYGLYAAIVPAIVGALFGWCGQLQTGPVAMTSMVTAAVLAPFALAGSPHYVELAVLLGLLVGLIRLALGLCHGSFLLNVISHPVVLGFTSAAGLIIAGSQIHEVFGLPAAPRTGTFLWDEWQVVSQLGQARIDTVAFAVTSFGLLLWMQRWKPLPAALVVSSVATVVAWLTGYAASGGHVIGAVPHSLPPLTIPAWDWAIVADLLPGAVLVTVVGFLEVLSASKTAAARTRQAINLDQELVGQGLAGIAGSFTGAFPVSGSLSRSAVNLDAGAGTGISAIVTGLFVLAVLLLAAPLLYHLPVAVLAAVILAAVLSLIDLGALNRAWRVNRHDGLTGWTTFIATLVLAPNLVAGFAIGASLAMVLLLVRMMRPRVVVVARAGDGTWRDAHRHGLAMRDDLVLIRLDGRLSFVNVAHVEESVLEILSRFPRMRALVLSGDGLNELDASGEDLLRRLHDRLGELGAVLAMCGLKAQITDTLSRSGLDQVIGAEQIYRSEDAALVALEQRLGLDQTQPGFEQAAP